MELQKLNQTHGSVRVLPVKTPNNKGIFQYAFAYEDTAAAGLLSRSVWLSLNEDAHYTWAFIRAQGRVGDSPAMAGALRGMVAALRKPSTPPAPPSPAPSTAPSAAPPVDTTAPPPANTVAAAGLNEQQVRDFLQRKLKAELFLEERDLSDPSIRQQLPQKVAAAQGEFRKTCGVSIEEFLEENDHIRTAYLAHQAEADLAAAKASGQTATRKLADFVQQLTDSGQDAGSTPATAEARIAASNPQDMEAVRSSGAELAPYFSGPGRRPLQAGDVELFLKVRASAESAKAKLPAKTAGSAEWEAWLTGFQSTTGTSHGRYEAIQMRTRQAFAEWQLQHNGAKNPATDKLKDAVPAQYQKLLQRGLAVAEKSLEKTRKTRPPTVLPEELEMVSRFNGQLEPLFTSQLEDKVPDLVNALKKHSQRRKGR
jgi:hypothetical protein